ncbi:MAG: sugar phosphate isomerase/epimerase [Planctomycetota bacterium]|nr:sugar phosphate isomerase/epimerase [Planctomycetota bacterium]
MDRREFLKTSIVAASAVAGLGASGRLLKAADAPKSQAVLKLCSQESLVPGKSLKEKVENILKFGGCGLEFGGLSAERGKQIRQELAGTGVGVAALCCGYYPLIDPDEANRKEGAEKLKKALEGAGEAGSTGAILVPAFNNHPQLNWDDGLKALADLLPTVGEYAVKLGTRILLEPLNKGEARFMNRLEQAVEICKASKSPGICLMGDFYHMCKEEKDDEQAFITADGMLHHIHLAGRIRWLPGQDHMREPDKPERGFVAGFRGLKKIGYQDYCSLECNTTGDKKHPSDPMVEIPKSFAFLKAQWAEANI